MLQDFAASQQPFWKISFHEQNHTTDSQRNIANLPSDTEVITVPADGLAPSGARSSAGTVMTKFGPTYIQDQHFKG